MTVTECYNTVLRKYGYKEYSFELFQYLEYRRPNRLKTIKKEIEELIKTNRI
jgi:hypothetical protein